MPRRCLLAVTLLVAAGIVFLCLVRPFASWETGRQSASRDFVGLWVQDDFTASRLQVYADGFFDLYWTPQRGDRTEEKYSGRWTQISPTALRLDPLRYAGVRLEPSAAGQPIPTLLGSLAPEEPSCPMTIEGGYDVRLWVWRRPVFPRDYETSGR